MKICRKTVLPFLAAILLLAVLAGCGNSRGGLPEGMDQEALESRALEFIDTANAQDYDRMVELFSSAYSLSAEEWETALAPVWEKTGAFKEYGDSGFATAKDDTLGELGVVAVETKYEEKTLVWQVAFDSEGNIVTFVTNSSLA